MSKMATYIYYPKSKKKLKEKQLQLRKERTELELAARKAKSEEDKECPLILLKSDIEKTRKALADTVTVREKWRKTEDSTLFAAIKACTTLKQKLGACSSVDANTAVKLAGVYNELSELMAAMRNSFIEASGVIFDDEEHMKKYYSKAVLDILELWGVCAVVTVDLMTPLIQEYWDDCDKYMDLAKAIASACSSCVKFTTVAVDTKTYPVPDGLEEKVIKLAAASSRRNADSLTKLCQAAFQTSLGHAEDSTLEMIEWMLFGLTHITSDVIQPSLKESNNTEEATKETKETEEKKETKNNNESMQNLNGELNNLFVAIINLKGELNDSCQSKKEEEQGNPETFSECSNAIEHLQKVYKDISDMVMESGKITISQEDPSGSEATIYFRSDQYGEVAKCSLSPCSMSDREKWLAEIPLTTDDQLISDIYVVQNGPLKTTLDVEIDFTVIPLLKNKNKKVLVKAKSEGEWKNLEDIQQEISEKDAHISFKTSNIEGFVAYVEVPSETVEVSPEGCTYTSESNGEIQVNFPAGIVQETQKFKIKVLSYNSSDVESLKEKFPDVILGITSVSDAVEIRAESDVELLKQATVQLPLEEDDDPDSQLVVIRYKGSTVQVLDKSQCHVKKEKNIIKVESKGLWCIAVAKIRKIFLNMRDTIKREFLVMFGMVRLCNICTFIDDKQRNLEGGSFYFWIECIDKFKLQDDIEEKKNVGLIEIQQSRSRDLALWQDESIIMTVDGQIKIRDPDPPEHFKITFLIGADNHLNIPMEVHRENDHIPYASLTFIEKDSDKVLHSVNVPVRDLSELPSDEITARQVSKDSENNSVREEIRKKEEGARQILSHESLMALARELTESEAMTLGLQLGVNEDVIKKFKDEHEGDTVRINFLILCEWRGKTPRATMVDFLISSLKTNGHPLYSIIVKRVRNKGRALVKDDFK